MEYSYTEDYGTHTCSADTFAILTINDVPNVAFDFNNECKNDVVSFTNNTSISNGTLSYVWDFGIATSDEDISTEQTPSYTYQEAGNYFVQLQVASEQGCSASALKTITIHPRATPDFTFLNVCTGCDIALNNTTTVPKGEATLVWEFEDGQTSVEEAPSKSYDLAGNYEIKLTATTDQSCQDEVVKQIEITNLPTPVITIEKSFSKIVGDAFTLAPSSPSDGLFKYIIEDASACAIVDSVSGLVTITCGDPDPIFNVMIYQEATEEFSIGMTSTKIDINKKDPEFVISYEAFDLVTNESKIDFDVLLGEGVTAVFTQISGEDVAVVTSEDGAIEIKGEGFFVVKVTVPATINTAEFEEVYEFRIYKTPEAPIVISDTIRLERGFDTIVNILKNDQGVTASIVPELTDIDFQDEGSQQTYYDPSIGFFYISENGDLTIELKDFIFGENIIKYRVVDKEGLWSDYGNIVIIISEPETTPELQSKQ